jgi:riboflavin kinase/FMN adenylyltransferase
VPANGIYACRAHVGNAAFLAATNIGTRPTFDNGLRTIEAHLLDFDGDLYGQMMTLDMIEYQRPELKFDSVDALIAQMREDVRITREILARDA